MLTLVKAQVWKYKSIEDSTPVALADDVTVLVGENESGKTAFLEALHKALPLGAAKYDYVADYPRKDLVRYRPQHEAKNYQKTVELTFRIEKALADDYKLLEGKINLPTLQQREAEKQLTDADETARGLLQLAGTTLQELMSDEGYETAKAKLEAIGLNITQKVFEFWKQNQDLDVEFDLKSDAKDVAPYNGGVNLYIRIKNRRHGVTVPFDQRSKGFIWFFSFLVWFDAVQSRAATKDALLLLLDEPGLNLHALAQADFLAYIRDLSAHHQIIYTTHSPFMVDSARLEDVRVVEDGVKEGTRITGDLACALRTKQHDKDIPMQLQQEPFSVEETGQDTQTTKVRAPRNRTLTVADDEKSLLSAQTVSLSHPVSAAEIEGRVIQQDLFQCVPHLPDSFIDLLVVDPPYNLNKTFAETKFAKTSSANYEEWLETWLGKLVRCLKPTASIYVCCDWQSSGSVQAVLQRHFIVRNRITWEREKGRGASANWKNCSEDIWFCTKSKDYFFDVEAVKLKKKVIAPYRDKSGAPKDWQETASGNFRLTHPSNLWTDISIPFWSMPENTDHPTQKPEKLLAKLILASSREGDFVFDPFLGSGSTCVAAKKLRRRFSGVEVEADYCRLAVKRLGLADADRSIQGYHGDHFWERNSLSERKLEQPTTAVGDVAPGLFDA